MSLPAEYRPGRDRSPARGPPVPLLRAGLAAGADAGERKQVVRICAEDRIAVEVLRRVEAMEVLRAVGRPPRADEERDDRHLREEDLLELRGDHLLLLRVERDLPLVEEIRGGRIVGVRPVPGRRRV